MKKIIAMTLFLVSMSSFSKVSCSLDTEIKWYTYQNDPGNFYQFSEIIRGIRSFEYFTADTKDEVLVKLKNYICDIVFESTSRPECVGVSTQDDINFYYPSLLILVSDNSDKTKEKLEKKLKSPGEFGLRFLIHNHNLSVILDEIAPQLSCMTI